MMVHGSNTLEYDKMLMVSDKISTSLSQWTLDLVCSYHVYCRKKLFDSLEVVRALFICRTD